VKSVLRNTAIAVSLAGLVGAGVLGLKNADRAFSKPLTWTEKEVLEQTGQIDLPIIYGNSKIYRGSLAIDIDKDNEVDALLFNGNVFRYSKNKVSELKARGFQFEYDSKELTPELKRRQI
jgi:hypothetical protein